MHYFIGAVLILSLPQRKMLSRFFKRPGWAPIRSIFEVAFALPNCIAYGTDFFFMKPAIKPEPNASPAPVRSISFRSLSTPACHLVLLSETVRPFGPSVITTNPFTHRSSFLKMPCELWYGIFVRYDASSRLRMNTSIWLSSGLRREIAIRSCVEPGFTAILIPRLAALRISHGNIFVDFPPRWVM